VLTHSAFFIAPIPRCSKVYSELCQQGVIVPAADFAPPVVPQDLDAAKKAGKVGGRGRLLPAAAEALAAGWQLAVAAGCDGIVSNQSPCCCPLALPR
jgi:hypothetical protein